MNASQGIKLGLSVFYVLLLWIAISWPLTMGANISKGLLMLLLVLHVYECVAYREIIKQAPGSTALNLLNVFLYGVVHKVVMKTAIREGKL